jgi:hypothetical protein
MVEPFTDAMVLVLEVPGDGGSEVFTNLAEYMRPLVFTRTVSSAEFG